LQFSSGPKDQAGVESAGNQVAERDIGHEPFLDAAPNKLSDTFYAVIFDWGKVAPVLVPVVPSGREVPCFAGRYGSHVIASRDGFTF